MDEFTSRIEKIGYGGEGICYNDGKICFVKYCLPGEMVAIQKLSSKADYDIGQIKTILEKSEKRIVPKCPYYMHCGGCDFQHTSYQNELELKKQIMRNQLTKLGYNIDFNIVASEKEYFYRNKIRLFPGQQKLGFKKEQTNSVIEIDNCEIANKLINISIPILSKFVFSQNIDKYLKYLEIRSKNNQLLINLFTNKKLNLSVNFLQDNLKTNFGLFQTINNKTEYIYGIKNIETNDNSLKFCISPNSFVQINDIVAQKLYNKVIETAKGNNIINCYSGAGFLSALLCLNGAQKVYGVELGINEHNDAEKLKKANNITNLINIQGDCALELPKVVKNADFIILDPPRKGCDNKVCNVINNSKAKQIIYISCNHATFARDVKRLNNYKLSNIELYDMFPRTCNFEIFSILQKI